MQEIKKRSLIKALSWRITGSVDTFLLSLLITGQIKYAASISFTEVVTKVFLYYIHERVWGKIVWGKQINPASISSGKSEDYLLNSSITNNNNRI